MEDLWNYLKNLEKPIVLYGMGNGADKIISVLNDYGIKISGVFASDGFVREKNLHGMKVSDYKTAKAKFPDMAVLLCFGTALPEVIENIKNISKENEFYVPDVPVCGGDIFTLDYYKRREEEFKNISDILADEISKNVFENVIKFKLTGKPEYLFSCETDTDEPYDNFLKLNESETFLDLGAYRGDTVISFINRVKKYNKIVAIEPDIKTFKKLCENTKIIKNNVNINAFAGEKSGIVRFNANGSRGVGKSGKETEVNVISVDELNIAPTFIKMDIEGAEISAIRGTKKTISEFKPKMQIATYHKSGDLIEIPKEILKCRSDYKVYLRHNPCLPAWDINYFFV